VIVGTLRIQPAAHRHAQVLEIFQAIQRPVLVQPGCLAGHIYEEPGALEAHVRSETYRQILGAIELSGGPPEVCFDYVSATEGMDLIERARDPAGTTGAKGKGT
jgi:quinol monooxygenase YgiN